VPLKISYVENVVFEIMKHSHRDVQVRMWDMQRNLSEQAFPHSLMIQEVCDYNVCLCETSTDKGCMFSRFRSCVDEVAVLLGCDAGSYPRKTATSRSKSFRVCVSNMKLVLSIDFLLHKNT
jgi:hypothetical protein